MNFILELLGSIIVLIGSFFLFLGALGIVRMPDVYNRIQAGTKATTLGTLCVCLGFMFFHPLWIPKLILITIFVFITNPVSSHAIARAAHSVGVALFSGSIVDKLKRKIENKYTEIKEQEAE